MSSHASELNQTADRSGLWNHLHHLLSNDFCPGFNKYVYWLKHPLSLIVVGILSSLLLALFLNQTVFWSMVGMTSVLIMAVVWPWITVKGIKGELFLESRRTQIGQPVKIKLKLTNKWPWPLWGLIVVKGFFKQSQEDGGMSLSRMPAWTTVTFTWNFTPSRRGIYPLETPQIETSFPLGLFTCRLPLKCHGKLIVWPETIKLEGLPDSRSVQFQSSQFTDRKAGEFGDLLGTRGFREGDSLRRIHWGQTARMQTMIVCERQSPVSTSLELLIDASRAATDSAEQDERVEQVLSISASIVQSVVRQNAAVSCHLNGVVYEPGQSHRDYERFMDALAQIPWGGCQTETSPALPRYLRSESLILIGTTDSSLFNQPEHSKVMNAERCKWIQVGTLENNQRRSNNSEAFNEENDWRSGLLASWNKGRLRHV